MVDTNKKTATVICNRGTVNLDFDGTEGHLFLQVAQMLPFIPAPDTIRIMMDQSYADVEISTEGNKLICNDLKLKKTRYEKKYLTRIDPETNRYEFYKITPYNMGPRTIACGGSFGRIGSDNKDLDSETVIKTPYPSCMYWIRYYEKLNQGYQDMSDYIIEEDEELQNMFSQDDPSESASDLAAELYNKLRGFAKDALSSQMDVNFLTEKSPFTKKQISNSWKIWKSLGTCKTVDEFNKKLLELISISPRKIDKYRGQTINSLLAPVAKTGEEQMEIFADIINREESLIQAMEAVTSTTNKFSKTPVTSPFGNIEISEPDQKEIEMVKSHLSDNLKPLVKKVYRIHAVDQQEKYDLYRAENNIAETKLLWHGSRNENWISIIKNSLMLNPNAVITGKMWGSGIYFAPSSMKSWGYTSRGKWTGGNANTVYMGLYETAYGNPYYPTKLMNGTKEFLKKENADCIHAKSSVCGLLNDEIIYFSEEAVCIQYLVEFETN